jgi:hypothetical protein
MRLALLALALAGCAGQQLPGDPSRATPEQIKAMAADRNANVACSVGTGPWGKVTLLFAALDRGVIPNGVVSIDPDCKTVIDTRPKEK